MYDVHGPFESQPIVIVNGDERDARIQKLVEALEAMKTHKTMLDYCVKYGLIEDADDPDRMSHMTWRAHIAEHALAEKRKK